MPYKMRSLEAKFVVLGTQVNSNAMVTLLEKCESCFDVREHMDLLNSIPFLCVSEEQKLLFIGPSGVGKTSVVVRYVSNMFNKHASPTIGASFFTCKMLLDNYNIKLQVWDTAGQERFRSMAPMYYRKANAAMLVFDITNEDSFLDMKTWVHELRKNVDTKIVLCVLGNKCDLENERRVTKEDACEYARSINAMYFETSALSSEGIQESFCAVAKDLIDMYEEMPNSGIRSLDSYQSPFSRSNDPNSVTLSSNQHWSGQEAEAKQGLCC